MNSARKTPTSVNIGNSYPKYLSNQLPPSERTTNAPIH
jgi:hypothetical protein